jgi:hypothetical protein
MVSGTSAIYSKTQAPVPPSRGFFMMLHPPLRQRGVHRENYPRLNSKPHPRLLAVGESRNLGMARLTRWVLLYPR